MEIEITSDKIKCPGCKKPLIADIFEYETETGIPTEYGFHVYCEDWVNCWHYTYDDLLKTQSEVYEWLKVNCKITNQ